MAGTPTLSDSYWLAQSVVFQHRVQSALLTYCNTVSNETPTGISGSNPSFVHQARKNQVANILNPSSFANWLQQFTMMAAIDGNLIAAATVATGTYVPITSGAVGDTQAADGQSPIVTTTLINNAVAAAFNSFISGI